MTIDRDMCSAAAGGNDGEGAKAARRTMLTGAAFAAVGAAFLSPNDAAAHNQSEPTGRLFNVRAFGAVGNGTTDDTNAISAAIDAVWFDADGRAGVIYFPPGNYLCSRKLLYKGTLPNSPEPYGSTSSITLLGDGRGVSKVTFSGQDAGFDFRYITADRTFRACGLTLATTVPNGGTALSVSFPPDGGPYAHAHIEDLEIRPVTPGADQHWNWGIKLNQAGLSVVRGVWFHGRDGYSHCAIELANTNDTAISECHTAFSSYGIRLLECEGTIIRNCYIERHYYGVQATSVWNGLPFIEISSCSIIAHTRGIELVNRNEATICNNVIQGTRAGFISIECRENCTDASIHNNRLVQVGSGPCIVHSGQRSQITHNVANVSPCVTLRQHSIQCVVVGNTSIGYPVVIDELRSPNNIIRYNSP